MAKEGYPAKALIKLLEEVAEKNGYPPNKKGVANYARETAIEKGKLIIQERYLENRYHDFTQAMEKDQSAVVNPKQELFDLIAEQAGYRNLRDFLLKNGHPVEKKQGPVKRTSIDHLLKRNPPHTKEWLDKYTFGAQIMPAFLGGFPLLITLVLVMPDYKPEAGNYFIFGIVIGFGLVIALSGWLAIAGKRWESKIFFSNGKKGFPTTYLMLFSMKNKFSEAQKQEYRDKVATYFGIHFPTKAEEETDESTAIQKLHQAGVKINKTIKSTVIRSAQIRYGFHRNLIPASIMAIVMAIPGAIYGVWRGNLPLIGCMVWCMAAGLYYYLLHGKWVKMASEAYARYLIDEFLSR